MAAFNIASTFILAISLWQRDNLEFKILFTSNCEFCNEFIVLGELTDHGLKVTSATKWLTSQNVSSEAQVKNFFIS